VTHLPQVAAYADRHLVVDKSSAGQNGAAGTGRVRSSVRTLPESDRIVELARMLAGLEHTDTGRAHAEELLAAARAHREADRAAAANGSAAGQKKRRKASAAAG
jgi:DNA repair protein RecN (Recombination protein N)